MKILKYIGQILASLIYTPIYIGIMYYVIVIPTSWALSLSFWSMIALLVLLGSAYKWLLSLIQTFVLLPYAWIIKDNKVAFWLSLALFVLLLLYVIFLIWWSLYDQGIWAIVAAVVLSILFLYFLFDSVSSIFSKSED